VSDAQLRQAAKQLEVVLVQLSGLQGQAHAAQAARDVQEAIGQLQIALSIK